MNCFEAYFEMVMDIKEPRDEHNAFSQLDHEIQFSVGLENCPAILETNYCELYDVPLKYKVYFAALAEYIFRKCGKQPPEWVNNPKYSLSEPEFPEGVTAICRRRNNDRIKQIFIDSSLPEFKKRNYMITDVLSAV